MPFFLSQRNTRSTEQMDKPDCDADKLVNTYRQFAMINGLLSQWKAIYRNTLRPYLGSRSRGRILDIGFGGGDVAVSLAQWARRDGLDLQITAIDTDARAWKFAQTLDAPPEVEFLHCSTTDLLAAGRTFDFVISNHLIHHLSEQALHTLLSQAHSLSHHGVIFNDIRRSDIGFVLFHLLTRPVFRRSFIIQDGLTSIKRSYTFAELAEAVPDGWQVSKKFPFRLLLSHYE